MSMGIGFTWIPTEQSGWHFVKFNDKHKNTPVPRLYLSLSTGDFLFRMGKRQMGTKMDRLNECGPFQIRSSVVKNGSLPGALAGRNLSAQLSSLAARIGALVSSHVR